MNNNQMPTIEQTIAAKILLHFAGPFYVASPAQQNRIVSEAADSIAPLIREIEHAARTSVPLNPS